MRWPCRLPADASRNPRYFGFRIRFPAAYDRDFFAGSEEERVRWVAAIQGVSGVRRIEDFYDICEKIGEGRFAEVYRVGLEGACETVHRQEDGGGVRGEGDPQDEADGGADEGADET